MGGACQNDLLGNYFWMGWFVGYVYGGGGVVLGPGFVEMTW